MLSTLSQRQQIGPDDDLAVEAPGGFGGPLFVADVGVGGDEVGQDECLDVGGLRHGADAVGGGVAVEQVLAQVGAGGAGKYPVQSRFVEDFVDEDVGALRQFDQRRAFG